MASVRKRILPSGKVVYQADYRDGGGRRRARQFEKKREADDFLLQARHEVSQGMHTPDSTSITVAEAGELWLARCRGNQRERTTLKQYRSHLVGHIVPLIGAERLSRLSTPRIEAFADELLWSRSRVLARKVLVSFKSMLRDAQRRGLVAQNVALPVRIDITARDQERIAIPTKVELKAMLEQVRPRWRALLITAMLTGLRTSELRGLTWRCVNLDSRLLHVERRADAFNALGPPKSRAGRRTVPLSPMVVNALREWRLACPKGPLDLVFPNTLGTLMQPPDILRLCWYPLMAACGLMIEAGADDGGKPFYKPKYDFHHLRHAAASLLIEQGAPAEANSGNHGPFEHQGDL
jgi:integrase